LKGKPKFPENNCGKLKIIWCNPINPKWETFICLPNNLSQVLN